MTTGFGAMVRARRRALGLTLAELAHRAGLSANYLQTVEAGGRDASLSTIEAVASALGVSPGELLGDVKRLSAEALEGGRLLDALTPEGKGVVVALLRVMAAQPSTGSERTKARPPSPDRRLNPAKRARRRQ